MPVTPEMFELNQAVQHIVHSNPSETQYADFFLLPHDEAVTLVRARILGERDRMIVKEAHISQDIIERTAEVGTRKSGMEGALDLVR